MSHIFYNLDVAVFPVGLLDDDAIAVNTNSSQLSFEGPQTTFVLLLEAFVLLPQTAQLPVESVPLLLQDLLQRINLFFLHFIVKV